MTRNRIRTLSLALLLAWGFTSPVGAGNAIEVDMLDRGEDGEARVFAPDVVFIEPGDRVQFEPVDLGHDVRSLDALRPEGAESFSGFRNAPLGVQFKEEGVHVYECEAHRDRGMVGVVVVGDPSVNLEDIEAAMEDAEDLSDNGRERLSDMLARVRENSQS